MEVVVGTYNSILFGFTFQLEDDDEQNTTSWNFKPLFTDQGHSGCIKAVSTGGRYLASGSTDEMIRLFDMKKHVEVGTVVQQDGSITSLVFCGTSNMLSGSEDGTICIWKTKTWELEKTLKGHKGAVNSISLHPSGRLALSVSKDRNIKTWNLLTGRAAFTTCIKEVGEIVRWSPNGDAYAIVVGCKVAVYKIKGVHDPIVYTCEKYILAMTFLDEAVLLLAGESKDILLYNFEKKLVLQRITAHKVRTKAIHVVSCPGEEHKLLLFTVASNGNLKAWSLNKEDLSEEVRLLASIDLPGRPTCLTVRILPEQTIPSAGGKKKSKEISNSAKDTVVAEVAKSKEVGKTEASVDVTGGDSVRQPSGDGTVVSIEKSMEEEAVEPVAHSNEDKTVDPIKHSSEEENVDSMEHSTANETVGSIEDSSDSESVASIEHSSEDETVDSTGHSSEGETVDSTGHSSEDETADSIENSTDGGTVDSIKHSTEDDTVTSIEHSTEDEPIKSDKNNDIIEESHVTLKKNRRSSSEISSSSEKKRKKTKKKNVHVGD